ncbi:hypothetical protein J3R83DRAFT_5507 [Lanmaoa asiatica]|nr:hypothetical protein J3R83DRAFT_5507 [Lanmaoa asiatica]
MPDFCKCWPRSPPEATDSDCSPRPADYIALTHSHSSPNFDIVPVVSFIMATPEFIADITEDMQERPICFRCHVALEPENTHLIRSSRPNGRDKLTCPDCCVYYRNKATTVRMPRPDTNIGSHPDPQVIRASVSAAQSRSTANPPAVVAMGGLHHCVNMPPPPVSVPRGKTQGHHRSRTIAMGPQVPNPSVWAPSASSSLSPAFTPPQKRHSHPLISPGPSVPAGSLPLGSFGYGEQHLQYAAERACWANAAHRPPNAETTSLKISAVFEGGGKRRNVQTNFIGSICEGIKDIDAQTPARDLAAMSLKLIVPQITAYDPQFPWRPTEFVVRDKKWVNLSANKDLQPYFYNECLHASRAKNSKAVVFKSDQFTLFVVVPEKQWAEYEEFKQKRECDLKATQAARSDASNSFAVTVAPPQPHSLGVSVAVTSPSQAITPSSSHHIRAANNNVAIQDPSEPTNMHTVPTTPLPLSTKRHHQHSSSITSLSLRSPPAKRTSNFMSPDRQELREALIFGGEGV